MTPAIDIDVAFDLICPWCLIGKRNLDNALESLRVSYPDVTVRIRWHGVQLLPGIPVEGVPFAEFYEQRLGSKDAVRIRQAQVKAAASRAELDIHLERIQTMPNTGKAHRLLAYAEKNLDPAQYEALLERLFAAYFVNGENIGDATTLIHIASSTGLDISNLASWLALPYAPDNDRMAHAGVPFFVFNQRYSISGAQSPMHFTTVMQTLITDRLTHDAPNSITA
jgi:predicted DsbA family dithiol-disulfide isomerase